MKTVDNGRFGSLNDDVMNTYSRKNCKHNKILWTMKVLWTHLKSYVKIGAWHVTEPTQPPSKVN